MTSGIPYPTIKWTRRNGESLPAQAVEDRGNLQSVPTRTKLIIPYSINFFFFCFCLFFRIINMQASSAGEYVCEARNNAGMTSAVAVLEVKSVPTVNIRPSSGTLTVPPGQNVKLYCDASGSPSPSVTWAKHTPQSSRQFVEYVKRDKCFIFTIFPSPPPNEKRVF